MFTNSKKLRSLFKHTSGFTLTEILVVLVVIAVLGAIATPTYMKAIKRSRASDALKVLSLASAKQEAYLLSNERYAKTFTELSAPVKGLVGGEGESVKLGYFEYKMEEGCLTASREEDKYTIYRNYDNNETGCVGEGCDNLQGLIPTKGSAGCKVIDTGIGEGNNANDPCKINPGLPGCNDTGGNGGETGGGDDEDDGGTGGGWSCNDSDGPLLQRPRRDCGVCGMQFGSLKCENDRWVVDEERWEPCNDPCGIVVTPIGCKPGDTQACGTCGKQTCNIDGTWGSKCLETAKPSESESCGCNNGGTKTRTPVCNTAEATWDEGTWGDCSINDECECTGNQPPESQACGCNKQGTQTRTVICDDSGNWTEPAWGLCDKLLGVCKPGDETIDTNCFGARCLPLTCNDQCQWENPNGNDDGNGNDDDNDDVPISPLKSSMCCARNRYCGGPPKTCTPALNTTFDFTNQHCGGGLITWYDPELCLNLPETCPLDNPEQPGYLLGSYEVNVYCGRLQLYECPSGYSFDNASLCKPGTGGKRYSGNARTALI